MVKVTSSNLDGLLYLLHRVIAWIAENRRLDIQPEKN